MAYIPDEAIDRLHELSKSARHLYVFLARCRNQKTGRCCPSVLRTTEALGCNRATVYALRKELTDLNWANFEGDEVHRLFGFDSPTNQTVREETKPLNGHSPTTRTDKSNFLDKSNFSDKSVQLSGQESPTFWTDQSNFLDSYKEEPAKEEPAKGTSIPVTTNPSGSTLPPGADAQAVTTRRRDTVFEMLVTVCQINLAICTEETRGAANQTAAKIRRAYAGQTEDAIAALIAKVGSWWWSNDWRARGATRRPPKPHEIREVWDQAIHGPPGVVVNGVNLSEFAQTAKTAGNDIAGARWLARYGAKNDRNGTGQT